MGILLFILLVLTPLFIALRALKMSRENPYILEHKKRRENREKYVSYLNWLSSEAPEEIPLPEVMDETEIERRIESRERFVSILKLFR